MNTIEMKERPGLKGKTVGDKCLVTVDGVIKSVSKHTDYSESKPVEVGEKPKKEKEYIYYSIEFSDSESKVDDYGDGDTQDKIGKIVDKSKEAKEEDEG